MHMIFMTNTAISDSNAWATELEHGWLIKSEMAISISNVHQK